MNGLLGAQFAILETTSGRNGLTWSSSGGAARTALEAGWVLAAITTVRPELEGVTLRGPVWRSPSSTIFLAEGGPLGRIAVKICFEPGRHYPSEAAARRQHEALERVKTLSGSALLMPNPVGILPRHGIVLTEWIDGERLSQVIARSDEPTAIAAVSGAAEWIARLHGALPGEWKLLHTDQLLGDLARRVERLRQPDPLIAQAIEVLRNLSGRLADKPTQWAPVHGDFKPANLLDSPLGIVALDVELQESGPVQADLAQFLNHLQLGGSFPPTAGWSSRALALNRTFVRAYVAAAGRKMPPEALSWLQLAGALRLLARYSHRWTELRSAVSILRTRKLIRRIIQECHD